MKTVILKAEIDQDNLENCALYFDGKIQGQFDATLGEMAILIRMLEHFSKSIIKQMSEIKNTNVVETAEKIIQQKGGENHAA